MHVKERGRGTLIVFNLTRSMQVLTPHLHLRVKVDQLTHPQSMFIPITVKPSACRCDHNFPPMNTHNKVRINPMLNLNSGTKLSLIKKAF